MTIGLDKKYSFARTVLFDQWDCLCSVPHVWWMFGCDDWSAFPPFTLKNYEIELVEK